MSQLTAEELRGLPEKERWSPQESLALFEITDGFEHICGLATPQYVATTPDRIRWANAVRVSVQVTGEPATGQLAAFTARMMYGDRETYAD